jgi:hypothetical protein
VYLDNVVVTGEPMVVPADSTSMVLETFPQTEVKLISSLCDSEEDALELFRFKIQDPISGDDEFPTKPSVLIFQNAKPDNSASWVNNLGGVKLLEGDSELVPQELSITEESIQFRFTEGQLDIPEDGEKEYHLFAWLKDQAIQDGKQIQIKIPASDHGFEAFGSGSQFASDFGKDIYSPLHTLEVTADQLRILELTQDPVRDQDFVLDVEAIDAKGSRDLDCNKQVDLELISGSGELTSVSGLSQNLEKGRIRWQDLRYSKVEEMAIGITATELKGGETPPIFVQSVQSGTAHLSDWIPGDTLIPASITKESLAREVFRFKLKDFGDDAAPTYIIRMRFTAGPSNNSDWKKQIKGILLQKEGETLPCSVFFDSDEIVMEWDEGQSYQLSNGATDEFSLFIYLEEGHVQDGEVIQLRIDSLHTGWKVGLEGSDWKSSFDTDLEGPIFQLSVVADHLVLTEVPKFLEFGEKFTIRIQAQDEWGNRDRDAKGLVSLSVASGKGKLSSDTSLVQSPLDGEYGWKNLSYNYADNFTLLAETSGFETLLSDNISQVDRSSTVLVAEQQEQNRWLSSLAIHSEAACEVLRFVVVDDALHDSLPTILTTLKFFNSRPVNGLDWTKHIAGAILREGSTTIAKTTTIASDEIRFNSGDGVLTVENGTSRELSLYIWFRKSQLPDHQSFQCFVPAMDHGWKTKVSGSALEESFLQNIEGPLCELQVKATKLFFIWNPFVVDSVGQAFDLKVGAGDIYQNIDQDAGSTVCLKQIGGNGTLYVSNEGKGKLEAGEFMFSEVNYSLKEEFALVIQDETSLLYSDTLKLRVHGKKIGVETNFETEELNGWNPTEDWTVSSYSPLSGNYSLKHNLTLMEGSSRIYYKLQNFNWESETLVWRFLLGTGEWDPSSTNRFCYCLVADQPSLEEATRAYVVGVNMDGSDDLLSLWKLNEFSDHEVMIRTDLDWNASDVVAVQVIRSPEGKWTLAYNRMGQWENLWKAGEFSEEVVNAFPQGMYTGLEFEFGSTSRAGLLWGDDFQVIGVGNPPIFKGMEIVSPDTIRCWFSEDLSEACLNESNFDLYREDSLICLEKPQWGKDHREILLPVSEALSTGAYRLKMHGLQDESADEMNSVELPFDYFAPVCSFDVVINEIMADEAPSVGLPEYEYIELYNRSVDPIPLEGWQLEVNLRSVKLPPDTIQPGAFLLLSSTKAENDFEEFGEVLGVPGFPALINTGGRLRLVSFSGKVIDEVDYSDSWYRKEEKLSGGWSLERIDPNEFYREEWNWWASNDARGGTPGTVNSIFGKHPDQKAPEVVSVKPGEKDTELLIKFSEALDTLLVLDPSNFELSHNVGHPTMVELLDEEGDLFRLDFEYALPQSKTYEIRFSENFMDWAGNKVNPSVFEFVLPGIPQNSDVLINEVLFNPYPGNVDFVELWNLSDKIIDISGLFLANRDEEYQIEEIIPLSDEVQLLSPEDYLVLTTDSAQVFQQYPQANADAFVEMKKFPPYPDDRGRVLLLGRKNIVLDEMEYDEKMHFSLLSSLEGVSLERISPWRPSLERSNWHSAAQNVGFATPGLENSVYRKEVEDAKCVKVYPEMFSPNMDGVDDVLHIRFQLEEPGYVANINIYDAQGRVVRKLARNQLLGNSMDLAWDGLTGKKNRAPVGIYIVYIELFHPEGKVRVIKRTCVLAAYMQ